ncbi:hypothetical protein ABW21_db0204533 [Orbilia brochopaga]|nr:hypothetical protein ABW21_db0204533 [Drechslerella brochopaga]
MKSIVLASTLSLLFQATSSLPTYAIEVNSGGLVPRDQAADNTAADLLFSLDYETWEATSIGAPNQIATVVGVDRPTCAENCHLNSDCKFFTLEKLRYTTGPDTTSFFYRCTLFKEVLHLPDLKVNGPEATTNPYVHHATGYRYASTVPTIATYSSKCYGSYVVQNSALFLGTRTATDEASCVAACGTVSACTAVDFYNYYDRTPQAGLVPWKFVPIGVVCALYKTGIVESDLKNHNQTRTNGDLGVKDQSCVYTKITAPVVT